MLLLAINLYYQSNRFDMKLIAVFTVVILVACNNEDGMQKSVQDTTQVYPTDSNLPADTDDHNKNIFDTVPLDAPPSTRPRDSTGHDR